ncbi:hypothetical protein [Desulfovibrio desulfuricans]|uniref:hypothetical protein n=1 Tax=Desulfovibrio desulfuricans TaxID=876 RepID=UPI0003F5D00B|nr:hypothetical protein [Desulfovibrio desulfuricans]
MQFSNMASTMAYTESIVAAALRRSLGHTPKIIPFDGGLVIPCGKASSWASGAPYCGKVLVLGRPTDGMLRLLGLKNTPALPSIVGQDACAPARGELPFTESPAVLNYISHPLLAGLANHLHRRPFTRFDYEDEWNNLGFGRIRTDNSPWAVEGGIESDGAIELASIQLRDAQQQCHYAGCYLSLHDTPTSSILWCARPVGPLDSTEWSIVERFISDWRSDDMPCLPCLKQAPAGYRCLVTMRLDCDEDVASAKDVFDWYSGEGIPFSLALKTSLDLKPDDLALLQAVSDAGGTLLSHSHMHQLSWGPTPEAAVSDAATSRKRFEELFPSLTPVKLAVSPFHTNQPYAVQALAKTGFTGFVSGIIHNDPEYMVGRAGVVPFVDAPIVTISQQSMLHGDCYRRQHHSVIAHVMAFEAQYQAEGIFGYLDHPFSPRYQYDWESKEQRLEAHNKLITTIQSYANIAFWAQQDCFEFVNALAEVQLNVTPQGLVQTAHPSRNDIAYRFKGKEYLLADAVFF